MARRFPVNTLLALLFSVSSAFAQNENDVAALAEFRKSPTVEQFFSEAYGYAIFPTIGKGGIGIGGARGKGRVYVDGQVKGETTMTQVTVGFQLGGQAFSQIIFFQNEAAFENFTNGNFEFGAQATAVAITASAGAQAGTTGTSSNAGLDADAGKQSAVSYTNGMAVFTYAKGGLMYEASIGGQKFTYRAQ